MAWRQPVALALGAALLAGSTALAAGPISGVEPVAGPSPAADLAAATSVTTTAHPAPGADMPTAVIHFYQGQLSPLRLGHCRFTPSCSQYALEAIQAHGLLAGFARAADRLVRCNPSARRYYARGADGLLADPSNAESPGPVRPRLPDWLLPAPTRDIVPGPADSTALSPDSTRTRWAAEVASFAAALAAEGDCDRAATEYRRVAHLLGPDLRAWSHLRSGDCRFEAGEWAAAQDEYRLARTSAAPEADRAIADARAAACRFNAGDFTASADLLAPLAEHRPQALGGLGLCDMARGRWGAAEARLVQASRATDDSLQRRRLSRLAAWCERGSSLPRRNSGLASALSAVLPGSGQTYAGRASLGLRHLVFNAALLWTVVSLIHDERYPAAYLVAGLELPFYLGNVLGAGRSAREFNVSARLRFVARAIGDAGRTPPDRARAPAPQGGSAE